MSKASMKQKLSAFKDKLCAFFVKLGGKLKSFFIKLGEKIHFGRNKWKYLIYGCTTIATVVTFSVLLSWASRGNAVAEIVVKKASALVTEDARVEYVVGETPDPIGFALVIDGKIREDCKLDVDTSTAGVKAARVYYEDGNTTYEGYYPVTVFGVKHIDVRSLPSAINVGEDGRVELEGFVMWAELSGTPKQLTMQDEHPEWTTTVVASPSNYSVWLSESSVKGVSNVTVRCGNVSTAFAYTAVEDELIVLDSPSRAIEFTNIDEDGKESLTLLVTKPETDGSDGESGASNARGKYVYTDAEGVTRVYDFAYYIDGYVSHFVSNATFANGIDEKQVGDDLQVTIDGHGFSAPHSAWTGAILALQ